MSAEIIRFPKGDDGSQRLRRALQSLEQALDEQLAAVNAWRKALGELQSTTKGLGSSLRGYAERLDTLDRRVGALRGQAMQLEATADAALRLPAR
jgi:chromosome segregation ATPase